MNFCWIQINNAAITIQKPTVEVTAEEFSTIMAINFESVYHLSQIAHPLLKASGAGSIVFISSVCGIVAHKNISAYSVTKGISSHDPWYIPSARSKFLFKRAIPNMRNI